MPRWLTMVLQRVVVAPALIALTIALWVAAPLWLVATAVLSPFAPGWLRPLRLMWLLVMHLTLESIALVELFGLWIASGFGLLIRRPWFERVHYDIAQGYLWLAFREARRVLRLQVRTVGPTPDAYPGEPLLVFSRHAGPGDSFTLMYALMHWFGREPRVVLKETIAWDPMLGVLLHRLPSRFINANPGPGMDVESQIGSLARDLDANDAFVIFPEGGNFTPKRREKAIARLHRLGLHAMAERAEQMIHVLAPRPGGVQAALANAPEADVLLVAHTGLDHVLTAGDVWRELPMDKQILMGWWRVPREDIPRDRAAQAEWLYQWWDRIDEWIEEHRPRDLEPVRASWSRRRRQSRRGRPAS